VECGGDPSDGCTFYVQAGASAPQGPCAGRSSSRAFPTIGEAADALLNRGQVVCVEEGDYTEGDIAPSTGGTPAFPVEFRAVGRVIIRAPSGGGTCLGVPTTGFLLLGISNVLIDGFELEGFCDAAIQVRSDPAETVNSSGIVLRNNQIFFSGIDSGSGRGIDVAGEGTVVVEGNVVADSRGSGIAIQGCVRAPDVEPKCAPDTEVPIAALIVGNRTFSNDSHGVFIRGATGTVLENNRSFGNGGAGIQLNASATTRIFNNLIYENGADGIRVGAPDRGTGGTPLPPLGSPRATIINNTIYGNQQWGIEIGEPKADSPGAIVLNNILQDNGRESADEYPGEIGILKGTAGESPSSCGYVAGFNLVRNASPDLIYGPATPFNVYDIRGDAEFVAPAGVVPDFRVRNGSPAIDAGYADVRIVGISGSVRESGVADSGVADLGFHEDADQNGIPQVDSSIMPLFVRVSGRDSNKRPTTPATAVASIGVAADLARAGVEVVVGPGIYREGRIRIVGGSEAAPGRVILRADPSGRRTGDAPGSVRVDADGADTAFLLRNSCSVRVEGFQVTGSSEAGIQIQTGTHRAEVVHNEVFGNDQRGIQVVNASDVRIFDNLVYGNGAAGSGGGIQVGGTCATGDPDCPAGSPRSEITFNTVYGNEVNGIFVGAGPGDSSHATVRYNISVANRLGNAIQIGSNETREIHLVGLQNGFNVLDSFSDEREIDDTFDYFWFGLGEPLFVNSAAARFELDTDGVAAIDAGEFLSALDAGLSTRSTRVDRAPDEGAVDLGYHYPILDLQLVGDCNGDGRVSIAELVRGVNIALGRLPIEDCPAFDSNNDGMVSINELIQAINDALVDT